MKDTIQQALINRIDLLQHQVDSLKETQVLDKITYRVLEHQEVINNVREFYEDSWTKMLWVIGTFVALVGIALPLVIQWLQQRSFKKISDQLLKDAGKDFNGKLLNFNRANNQIVSQMRESFQNQITSMSLSNNEELANLNSIFASRTQELETDYTIKTDRLDANQYIYQAESHEFRDQYQDALNLRLKAIVILNRHHQFTPCHGNLVAVNSLLDKLNIEISKSMFDESYGGMSFKEWFQELKDSHDKNISSTSTQIYSKLYGD